MLYALRKLIAFVFLGGIFWFIYSDPAEIGSALFMHTLGALTMAFALFYLVIPEIVVALRRLRRRRQNAARHALWRAETNGEIRPLADSRNRHAALAAGEKAYWHEKGTLYVVPRTGFDAVSVRGRPGDVAFPGVRRNRRKIQRTHCYFTDRRIIFLGKMLSYSMAYSELVRFDVKPGGLVFVVKKAGKAFSLAFTFQNPLVAADYVRALRARA